MVPDVVLARRLEQRVGADDVGLDERPRLGEGVVVVRLGGEVDDRVVLGDEPVEQARVADVADDELDPVAGQTLERGLGGGVRQLVEDGEGRVGSCAAAGAGSL